LKEEDRDVAISEIYRVTKNGGYFVGKIATIEETDKNQTDNEILNKYGLKDLHINPIESNEWVKKFDVYDEFYMISMDIMVMPRCRSKISSSAASAKYHEDKKEWFSDECNFTFHYQIVKR